MLTPKANDRFTLLRFQDPKSTDYTRLCELIKVKNTDDELKELIKFTHFIWSERRKRTD